MKYPQYANRKPSDAASLGDVPKHWELKPIKYHARINEKTLTEQTSPELVISYIDIGCVDSSGYIADTETFEFENAPSRARRIVSSGDVLVSTVRTYLKAIAFVRNAPTELICSTGFAVLSAKPTLIPKFLFYWARANFFVDSVVSRSTGVSYPAINADEIGNIVVPIIPPEEQQTIAAFLDRKTAAIDALIREKEQHIAKISEKRQALISNAVTRGINPTVPLRPSGIAWLGDIPQHWKIVRLKYLASIKYGLGQPPSARDDGLPLLRATNIERGKINPVGLMFIDQDEVPYDRDPVLRKNDIIVVRSGAYTGDSALVPAEYDGAIAGYDMVVRVHRSSPHFIAYALLSTPILTNQINLFRMRAAQPHLNAEELGDCLFFVPPVPEQQAIVSYLNRETVRADELKQVITTQIARLRDYRQSLISEAVTGKIDVRGVEV